MRDIEAVGLTAGHVIGTCIVAPIKSFPLVLHLRCGNVEGGWVALQDVGQYDCRSEKPEYEIKEAEKGRLILNSVSFIIVYWVSKQQISLGPWGLGAVACFRGSCSRALPPEGS